jgi:hypothetical protein
LPGGEEEAFADGAVGIEVVSPSTGGVGDFYDFWGRVFPAEGFPGGVVGEEGGEVIFVFFWGEGAGGVDEVAVGGYELLGGGEEAALPPAAKVYLFGVPGLG